jgi:hypothetical protein
MMTERLPAPISRSYWVLTGRLLAGPYPGSPDPVEEEAKLASLLAAGVNCFINLMRADECDMLGRPFHSYEPVARRLARKDAVLRFLRFEIDDMSVPSISHMKRILDAVDTCLGEGCVVYLHCLGGVGRTGTVVGCYLARHGIALGDEALHSIDLLRGYNPGSDLPSPQTREQCSFVRSWEEDS